MSRVCPEWVQIYRAGALKAEFDFAVYIVAKDGMKPRTIRGLLLFEPS